MTERPCPVCGAADAQLHARQSFEALTGSLVNGYDVVSCRACGFAYAAGLPTADEFASYYTGMSRYENATTSYAVLPEDAARCEAIVDLVAPIARDRTLPVLDVGCATGTLLAAFDRRGFTAVEGIDPSQACAAAAAEMYGIRVCTGTAADLAGLGGEYGIVILSQVLEHLLDPLRVLVDAGRILRPDGLLVAEVPDVEGFAAAARAPFQEFSVEHINYFSGASLARLLGAAGFTPVALERRRVPWRSGGVAPVVRAVFRKTPVPAAPERDDVSGAALIAYIARSEAIENDVRTRIRALADRGRPVLVWGVGTHTRHLLQTGALDGLQVAGWVDSDPKYHGAEMRGAPVLAPGDVVGRPESILVSSGTVHHEIARQIRADLGVDGEVILLYE